MRCPVCKAENGQTPQCRRCKADLSLLLQLEEQRSALLAAAAAGLRKLRFEEALTQASQADRLRHGPDSGRLLAVIHLLRYDFLSAWQHYQRGAAGSQTGESLA
jgi:hypothetical protein